MRACSRAHDAQGERQCRATNCSHFALASLTWWRGQNPPCRQNPRPRAGNGGGTLSRRSNSVPRTARPFGPASASAWRDPAYRAVRVRLHDRDRGMECWGSVVTRLEVAAIVTYACRPG